jgi:hypothetical protein
MKEASKKDANIFSLSNELHLERVQGDGYVYISIFSNLLKLQRDCSMAVVKEENLSDDLNVGLRKHSALTPRIDDL